MLWLTEKIGLVRCDEVDDMKQIPLFAGVAKNIVEKLHIVVHAKALNLLVQSAFQHGLFGWRKFDAIFPGNEGTQPYKTFVVHPHEYTFHFRTHFAIR